MASKLTKLLFRPGWRLKCIDPPLGWVRILDETLPVAELRLQITCFLTQSWASPVLVRDAQLRVMDGEREFIIPWTASADPDGEPLPKSPEFSVKGSSTHHAFIDFASDAPDLITLLETATGPTPIMFEGLFNAALEFRAVASLDMSIERPLLRGPQWQQVDTGRDPGRRS